MVALLIILLALASAWDVVRHRIPNAVSVSIAVAGVASRLVGAGLLDAGWSVLALVAAGGLLWPAWTRRWIGGGDLKLAAATAAWLPIRHVPVYLVTSALAVGALSLVCLAISSRTARSEIGRNLAFAARGLAIDAPIGPQAGRVQVPAGAAFAAGAVVTLLLMGGL